MALLLPLLLAAAAVPDVNGTWDLLAGGETIYRIEIASTPAGTTATWSRPMHLDGDNDGFSRVTGPVVRRKARTVRVVGGDLELTFDDPTPGAMPDVFRLHRVDATHLRLVYQGTGLEPFDLDRATAATFPNAKWQSDRTYVRTINRPTNPEMTALFDADQADRQPAVIDWTVVGPADRTRKARTQALLDAGALQSGDDYEHAAFIFQHGDTPGDYLKAHLLAMIAVARGKSDALWIASATLDRYLQSIGKPQVLGTQFKLPEGAPVSQDPFDRALVSDAVRQALRVPPLAEQEQEGRDMQAHAAAQPKP